MKEVLRVANLSQTFDGTTVLNNVSFALEPGERLAVLGPSGSGKTTLIRLIAGLEPPTRGDVTIDGKAASRAGEVLIAPERREVAMVFQGLALFPHLRALDQVAFAARGRGGVKQAQSLLERIGLGHRGNARLDELSGGERQRIALARALAQEPKLILMDEPFASLDDEKRGEMRDLLRSLLEKTQTTLILVTHSRHDALDLARRVLVLERGRPVAYDLLESVLARPRHVAAVRALGLGQIVAGEIAPTPGSASGNAPGSKGTGEAQTAFGMVAVAANAGAPEPPEPPETGGVAKDKPGQVHLFVRPGQPQIVSGSDGVEAEVVSFELRPSETRERRRIAIVRVVDTLLRVFVGDSTVSVGQRVRVRIEGECDVLEGEGRQASWVKGATSHPEGCYVDVVGICEWPPDFPLKRKTHHPPRFFIR